MSAHNTPYTNKNVNQQCHNLESNFRVKQFWKRFSILDSIGFVDKAWKEIDNLTFNKCWKKLMPDITVMRHETQTYESILHELLRLGREIGGEGFEDLNEPEIVELVQHQDK